MTGGKQVGAPNVVKASFLIFIGLPYMCFMLLFGASELKEKLTGQGIEFSATATVDGQQEQKERT